MSLFDEKEEPAFLILDTSLIYAEITDRLKPIGVDSQDILELFWQMVSILFTYDDVSTYERLKTLPQYARLKCAQKVLDNEYYEKLLREAIIRAGMQLHELAKSLGLYETPLGTNAAFNYTVHQLTHSKLILRKFFS